LIIIDTGPIVALFDKDDKYHALCIDLLKGIKEPLITTWPVLTEAFYLLNFSSIVQDNLWECIEREGLTLYTLAKQDYSQCRELMKKYRDLPMDLADATLVAIAEHMKLLKIFTLDHKNFRVYKTKHIKHFTLIPSQIF
jgi:predicted nucleic acid-binding protein